MIDGIDSSHWLPRGSSVINAQRANKGDLEITVSDGRISNATIKDGSLLGWMVERGILDELHRSYAMMFSDMQACFRRPAGYKLNTTFFTHGEPGDMDTLYLRVCRLIMGKTEWYVNNAIITHNTFANRQAAWDHRGHYQSAFDKLAAAIDQATEDLARQKEADKKSCANN